MAYDRFSVPNASAASFATQAKFFAQDIQILAEAHHGNGVLTGCAVTPQGSPDMTVHVAAGAVVREGILIAVSAANPAISAAHATLPRIDVVNVNNSGTLIVTAGTPAASPEPPTIPQVGNINNIVLAFVYVPAADTAIGSTQIIDKRSIVSGPTYGYVSVQQDITSAGFVDITNCTFPIAANEAYRAEWYIPYQTSTTAMGVLFGVNGPSSPTRISFATAKQTTVNTAGATTLFTFGHLIAYDTPVPNATSEPAQAADLVYEGKGVIVNGANAGTFALRLSKENVAGTASIMPGAWMSVRRLA